MLKNKQKSQYQNQSKKGFTPPRQLGISHKYAKLGGNDERCSSIYKEIDIELRSFVYYSPDGKTNGNYFKLTENKSIINTFDEFGVAEESFMSVVSNRIAKGWTMLKGDEIFVS